MNKTELILALVHCSFLKCSEKVFLSKNLDNLESLTLLSLNDICLKIHRIINTSAWKPDKLSELVQRDLVLLSTLNIGYTTILSPEYPPLLRELYDPPFVVFWRGVLPDPEKPIAAVVGTRMPSGTGMQTAYQFGSDFGYYGVPVVSGLARGIDASAHRGNIDAGAPSIAVLACGVDNIYPRSNVCLARRLVEGGGCVLSEYPPGDNPLQYRFPQRNRLISGLARAVVVVEAPEKSGALITADFALEQGRDLYVSAQTLQSEKGVGTRKLYDQGAPAIDSAGSIVEGWGIPLKNRVEAQPSKTDGFLSASVSTGRQLALDFKNELTRYASRGS